MLDMIQKTKISREHLNPSKNDRIALMQKETTMKEIKAKFRLDIYSNFYKPNPVFFIVSCRYNLTIGYLQ